MSDFEWDEALERLCRRGWQTDEIYDACRALTRAFESDEIDTDDLEDLTPQQVSLVLGAELEVQEQQILLRLASLYSSSSRDGEVFRESLAELCDG